MRGVVYQHQHQTGQTQHFTAGGADPVFTAPLHIGLSHYIIFCNGHHLPTTCLPLAYHLPTTWPPLGHHLPTSCLPLGYHLATTCLPLAYHLATSCL